MTVPICKNCRHFRRDLPAWAFFIPIIGWAFLLIWWITGLSANYAECTASSVVDPVSGRRTYAFCSTRRNYACGPDGKFFEPRA